MPDALPDGPTVVEHSVPGEFRLGDVKSRTKERDDESDIQPAHHIPHKIGSRFVVWSGEPPRPMLATIVTINSRSIPRAREQPSHIEDMDSLDKCLFWELLCSTKFCEYSHRLNDTPEVVRRAPERRRERLPKHRLQEGAHVFCRSVHRHMMSQSYLCICDVRVLCRRTSHHIGRQGAMSFKKPPVMAALVSSPQLSAHGDAISAQTPPSTPALVAAENAGAPTICIGYISSARPQVHHAVEQLDVDV